MSRADLPTVVATWIRHAQDRRKEDFWAWDWVMSQVCWNASAEDAWEIVVELVRAAPAGLLGAIGAGPLEDLVNRFGADLIDWIEGEARRDRRFQQALGAIWLRIGTLPLDIQARVVAASGGLIEPFELTAEDEAMMETEMERELEKQRNRQGDA